MGIGRDALHSSYCTYAVCSTRVTVVMETRANAGKYCGDSAEFLKFGRDHCTLRRTHRLSEFALAGRGRCFHLRRERAGNTDKFRNFI